MDPNLILAFMVSCGLIFSGVTFADHDDKGKTCLKLRADLEKKYLSYDNEDNDDDDAGKKFKKVCEQLAANDCQVTNLGENTTFCSDIVANACADTFSCSDPLDYCADDTQSCREPGVICPVADGDGVFCAVDVVSTPTEAACPEEIKNALIGDVYLRAWDTVPDTLNTVTSRYLPNSNQGGAPFTDGAILNFTAIYETFGETSSAWGNLEYEDAEGVIRLSYAGEPPVGFPEIEIAGSRNDYLVCLLNYLNQ